MKIQRPIACILALLLTAAVMPHVAALTSSEPRWTVPEGYNAHDYAKCVEFLEQEDEDGVKNGQKLDENYSPNDPFSWGSYMDGDNKISDFMFEAYDGEMHIALIKVNESDLVGTMDMAGCVVLRELYCMDNRLTGVDVTGCTQLTVLNFMRNDVSEVDVSTNLMLSDLGTAVNPIRSLDLSANAVLSNLFTGDDLITELDLTNNPNLPMDALHAEGNGYVGYMYLNLGIVDILALYANPAEGAEFVGWFDPNGELVSTEEAYQVPDPWAVTELTAVYDGGETPAPIPGDINASGAVDAADAMLALRYSMHLIDLTPEQLLSGDMNGDGAVAADDALMILRAAMHLA